MGPWYVLVCPMTLDNFEGGPYSMPTPVQKNDPKMKKFPVSSFGRCVKRAPNPAFGVPQGPCSEGVKRGPGAVGRGHGGGCRAGATAGASRIAAVDATFHDILNIF